MLKELHVALPIECRRLTEAELDVQEENDQRVITPQKWRFGPTFAELTGRFEGFTKRASVRSRHVSDFNAKLK